MPSPSAVALSPDGGLALVGYAWMGHPPRDLGPFRRFLLLYDTATGQEVRELSGLEGDTLLVTFLPDGRRAVAVDRVHVVLWDVRAGKRLWWNAHHRFIQYAAVSPEGKAVLTWGDRAGKWDLPKWPLKLWDVRTGKLVRTFAGYEMGVRRLQIGPGGKQAFIALSDNVGGHSIDVLDLKTGKVVRSEKGADVWWKCPLAFSPDGKHAVS
jgi:WD40 repeat protein